jgi:hypothetical protein
VDHGGAGDGWGLVGEAVFLVLEAVVLDMQKMSLHSTLGENANGSSISFSRFFRKIGSIIAKRQEAQAVKSYLKSLYFTCSSSFL